MIKKRFINILGMFGILLLIMTTSHAFAGEKISNEIQIDNVLQLNEEYLEQDTSHGDTRENWYDNATKRLSKLRLNNILLGRFILSIDDNLEISTPASAIMATRLTLGNPGITVLPSTEDYNLGFGVTTRISDGLSIATSVSLSLIGSSDVTFWVTLPTIHF